METHAHHRLKTLALGHLRGQGFRIAACEVTCPLHRYRVDVAGYLDSGASEARIPRTVIIECKQSRADYLHHAEEASALRKDQEDIRGILDSIAEHHVKPHEPALRTSASMLFAEMEDWDLTGTRNRAYQACERKLAAVEARLYGHTKFYYLFRYRLADELYIAAPEGLIAASELPAGWGLIECPRQVLAATANGSGDAVEGQDGSQSSDVVRQAGELRVSRPAAWNESPAHRRARLLRNIAVAGCTKANR